MQQEIQATLVLLQQHVRAVEELSQRVGGASDSPQLRHELTHERDQANAVSQRLHEMLSMRTESSGVSRAAYEKLKRDYRTIRAQLAQACKASLRKERTTGTPTAALAGGAGEWGSDTSEPLPDWLLSASTSGHGTLTDAQMAEERERELRELESEMVMLGEIMHETRRHVHAQGETITTLADNIAEAHEHTHDGTRATFAAAKLQRKLTLPLVGAAIGGLIGGPVGALLGAKGIGAIAGVAGVGAVGGALGGAAVSRGEQRRLDRELGEYEEIRADDVPSDPAYGADPMPDAGMFRARHRAGWTADE